MEDQALHGHLQNEIQEFAVRPEFIQVLKAMGMLLSVVELAFNLHRGRSRDGAAMGALLADFINPMGPASAAVALLFSVVLALASLPITIKHQHNDNWKTIKK